MPRSINSANGNAAPSPFGTPLLQERPPCAYGFWTSSIFCVRLPWLLPFEGRGSLDLAEIFQFRPSKRCAFDLRYPNFAYPPANHTPETPAFRTWILDIFDNLYGFALFVPLRRLRIGTPCRYLSIPFLETPCLRLSAPQSTILPPWRVSLTRTLYFFSWSDVG